MEFPRRYRLVHNLSHNVILCFLHHDTAKAVQSSLSIRELALKLLRPPVHVHVARSSEIYCLCLGVEVRQGFNEGLHVDVYIIINMTEPARGREGESSISYTLLTQKSYIILLYPDDERRPCVAMTPWVTPHFN